MLKEGKYSQIKTINFAQAVKKGLVQRENKVPGLKKAFKLLEQKLEIVDDNMKIIKSEIHIE